MALHSRKILIVDDHPVNRKLATMVLRNAGMESDEASGGEEALRMLAATPYECVLLDVNMPNLGGEEVCKRIRANQALRHLRVVAYTAHAFEQEQQRILQSGFDALVTKPISRESLLAAITA